jgi:phosphate transport system protein
MSTAQRAKMEPEAQYAAILEHTVRAYTTAEQAAAAVADCLVSRDARCRAAVQQYEQELDRLDREIDGSVSSAIAEVTPDQARELLSAMKMVIDLERIGDLLASVADCAGALDGRLRPDDVNDLVKMATLLEKMLGDAHGASIVRNVDRAIAVLRADADMDRYRNILLLRHLELAQSHGTADTVHVLFMAQALERAGDHVKNLAEEVCHLATGHTVRHVLRGAADKPYEQMYLQQLRFRHGISSVAAGVHPAAAAPQPAKTGLGGDPAK